MPILSQKPWGPLDWVVRKLPGRRWSLLGCLGPEERSLAVWSYLRSASIGHRAVFVDIAPSVSRYQSEHHQQMQARRGELQAIGVPSEPLVNIDLFANGSEIVAIADEFARTCGSHVILDVSSFPKRFFFAFVKRLLSSSSIESLVATYTLPLAYDPATLSEDHLPFAHLPLFGPRGVPEPRVDVVIVGAGFMKLGLAELLEPYKQGVAIKTLLPFPPGLPSFHRNWEFIREMKSILPEALDFPMRIGAFDCPDTFQHLKEITNQGTINAILAPFGPKPMSLAFCLFAIATNSVVYYTQPTVYNPFYSTGIRWWNGKLGSYAYCLRLNGRNLYSL
jgi:hypothetical protein